MEEIDYLMDVPRKEVESSNLKSIGYHKDTRTMTVEFHDGGVYKYHPITHSGYLKLIHADSIGSAFHKDIRQNKNISYEKLF